MHVILPYLLLAYIVHTATHFLMIRGYVGSCMYKVACQGGKWFWFPMNTIPTMFEYVPLKEGTQNLSL